MRYQAMFSPKKTWNWEFLQNLSTSQGTLRKQTWNISTLKIFKWSIGKILISFWSWLGPSIWGWYKKSNINHQSTIGRWRKVKKLLQSLNSAIMKSAKFRPVILVRQALSMCFLSKNDNNTLNNWKSLFNSSKQYSRFCRTLKST